MLRQWGVKQDNLVLSTGLILGPLLFSIYTNDHFSKCSTQSYVDDTKLITSFQLKDNPDEITDLKDDLFKIGEWCSNNLLLLNPGKTKLLIFDSRQMRAKLQISLPSLHGKGHRPYRHCYRPGRDVGF